MMAQVLFFDFFSEKYLHLNAVEFCGKKDGHQNFGYCKKYFRRRDHEYS